MFILCIAFSDNNVDMWYQISVPAQIHKICKLVQYKLNISNKLDCYSTTVELFYFYEGFLFFVFRFSRG